MEAARETSQTMKIKPFRGCAIVKKDKPVIDLNDVYRMLDIKDISIQKDERVIKVIIQEE